MSRIAIADFLKKCIVYADNSIQRKRERDDSPEIIEQWQTYRDYTQYALEELEKGDLDHWLERTEMSAENEIDIEELDHTSRAAWLAGILSPRPLALITTRNEMRENIAPISSLAVVSNSPPLIVMSLSKNRENKPRDTYNNLLENGKCELQFLRATPIAAKDIDLAGTQIDNSEWSLLDCDGPVHPMAVAILKCHLVEDRELPEGAVARLITLRVDSMITPTYYPPDKGLDILCQHGIDRITPAPNDWGHLATLHRDLDKP
ncbi:MAG: flavin reductase [Candidatus Poseidoniaceae archaeon]|jgi:flavin reductase (DIM6/NTAB) family NADH-FMN oxidoreductase RutF|nr:flavin reductase [Candidatus Poseidoniaceae archaeon]